MPTRKGCRQRRRARSLGGFNGAASLPTRKACRAPPARAEHRSASMGPRRCRRGRAPHRIARRRRTPRLQWGRVVADAEGALVAGTNITITVLQWGRVVADAEGGLVMSAGNSLGSGFNGAASLPTRKATMDPAEVAALGASMGPRRCRRGRSGVARQPEDSTDELQWGRVVADAEGSFATRARSSWACFNGAASLPTRKDDSSAGVLPRASRFNGAASLPTRKGGEADIEKPPGFLLQWGRVVADAEGTRRFSGTSGPLGASMGPRRCRRGRYADLRLRPHHHGASMGPRRCRRGRRPAARARGSDRGFNGAASLPTRKAARPRPWRAAPDTASMGPRRCRRGRFTIAPWNSACSCALQWGRVVADAEGYACEDGATSSILLQWGRVVADAEGGGTRRGGRRSSPRFNGAASLPTRKDLADPDRGWRRPLQWGRVVADAEG